MRVELMLAALTLALCASTARAQTVEARERPFARLVVSAGLEGRLAEPVCDAARTLRPTSRAAFTFPLARTAREADQPLILDAGGLLAPHGVPRFAALEAPEALAELVARLGYRALAVGPHDLAARRDGLLRVASALRARRIPMLASNLRCAESASALCDVLVDASDGVSTHMVGGHLVATIAVLQPDALGHASPERVRGLVFDPPGETVERLTRLARSRGAEWVVAVIDADVEGGVAEWVDGLDPDARPDVAVIGGSSTVLHARPIGGAPVIVGASPRDAVEVRAVDIERGVHAQREVRVSALGQRGISVAPALQDWIDQVGPLYCERWGRPLEGAELTEPLDRDAMRELLAAIVQDRLDADVVILPLELVDPSWTPHATDALSASDVLLAVRYDERLQTASVNEAWLRALAGRAGPLRLMVRGATWSDAGSGSVEVAGHPVDGRASYRAVTLYALAQGGDRLPALPGGERWEVSGEAGLRETALEFLEQAREADPREAVADPTESVEWRLSADADLTFSGSTVTNPRLRCTPATDPAMCDAAGFVVVEGARAPAYDNTQLSLSDVVTFGIATNLRADAAAPDWTWQSSGSLVYQTAWTEPSSGMGAAGLVEAADQIRVRSTFSWRGLRGDSPAEWYIPDPTVDLFVESEVTEPDSRDWHWLLLRPTAGFRFQLVDRLQLKLLGGFQTQLFDPQAEVEPGAGANLALNAWDLLSWDDRFTRLSFALDYFVSDLGDENRGVFRGELDASFDLAGPLALVFRVNALVQHQTDQDAGFALNVTAGLRLGTFGRVTTR